MIVFILGRSVHDIRILGEFEGGHLRAISYQDAGAAIAAGNQFPIGTLFIRDIRANIVPIRRRSIVVRTRRICNQPALCLC